MELDLQQLQNLLSKRRDEIEKCVVRSGIHAKNVIGVATFLLDNEGNVDLLSAKQLVIFEKFLMPLLGMPPR